MVSFQQVLSAIPAWVVTDYQHFMTRERQRLHTILAVPTHERVTASTCDTYGATTVPARWEGPGWMTHRIRGLKIATPHTLSMMPAVLPEMEPCS